MTDTKGSSNPVKPHFFQNKPILLGLIYIVILWVAVFWTGITTAVEIWIGSDIFNHCLFVLPGAFYLIYTKRHLLHSGAVKPNYWLLPLLIGGLLLYALGLAGDVQLFMHVAAFGFLPLALWCYLGNKLAYQIMFPLGFMLFSIPFGEEFIPFLQQITADWSVVLLNLTGIPIYRSGLYIEIPQGRFLVAEACSGISFFIASVVIGSLYTYLNINSWKRKIVFMVISIMFPVIANAIRVYGIILIGYLTNMEHAVGADHLIYGWFFFAIVIICLIFIGELIREKQFVDAEVPTEPKESLKVQRIWQISAVITCISLLFSVWFISISQQHKPDLSPEIITVNSDLLSDTSVQVSFNSWDVEFKEPFDEYKGFLDLAETKIDVYMAWYPKGKGELISSLNKLYSEKSWTLDKQEQLSSTDYGSFTLETIVNSQSKRLLTHWYVVNGKVFTDKKLAKLYEIFAILSGQYIGSGLIALSIKTEQSSYDADKIVFKNIVLEKVASLSTSFPSR